MGTSCGDTVSDEVLWELSEANEEAREWAENGTADRLWEEYSKEMPAIEAASENRAVELLRGNIEAGLNSLPEDFFRSSGENTILKLDAEAIPTEQECRENYRIGREIGMESYEIANFPVIMGVKDPETMERMKGIRDTIKDELQLLHQSKLSPWFRDSEVIDRIILVDKSAGKIGGATPIQKEFIADKSLPRVVHVFRNSDTGKMHEGSELHRVVIHEIVHLNLDKGKDSSEERDFRGIFHSQHRDEWLAACNAQIKGPGAVSEYAAECIPADGPQETGFLNPEFIAEHVAFWDADLGVEICPEIQAFLDKYLS